MIPQALNDRVLGQISCLSSNTQKDYFLRTFFHTGALRKELKEQGIWEI